MWAVFPALAFAAIQAGQPAIPASTSTQQAAPPTQAELVAFRSDPVLRMTIPTEIAVNRKVTITACQNSDEANASV